MARPINLAGCAAEFLGMFLFVAFCCGTATGVAGTGGWVQQVALTFGLCIFVLASALGRWGLQCNFAVTFGLAVATCFGIGDMGTHQAFANLVFQVLGSVAGAALVAAIKDKDSDLTGTLGSNMIADDIGIGEALAGEALGTFLLVFMVMQAVVDKTKNATMPLAIGTAVYIAHSILIPIDGCSINPTRSIGPALVSTFLGRVNEEVSAQIWGDMWVFWMGPLGGALLAVLSHVAMHSNTAMARSINLAGCAAEFLGMFLFVALCCGTATGVAGTNGWVQQVALTFGLCIFVLASALGRWGLQCNFAVTFGLAVATCFGIGDMGIFQAFANLVFQVLGSVAGAVMVAAIKGKDSDLTGTLGSNMIADDIDIGQALAGEVLGTFLLVFMVMQAVVDKTTNVTMPLAIGTAVYIAHSFLIPIDGCSINPTRSIGPALVSTYLLGRVTDEVSAHIWGDMWVFWVGPLGGALLAVLCHVAMHTIRGQTDAGQEKDAGVLSEKCVDATSKVGQQYDMDPAPKQSAMAEGQDKSGAAQQATDDMEQQRASGSQAAARAASARGLEAVRAASASAVGGEAAAPLSGVVPGPAPTSQHASPAAQGGLSRCAGLLAAAGCTPPWRGEWVAAKAS